MTDYYTKLYVRVACSSDGQSGGCEGGTNNLCVNSIVSRFDRWAKSQDDNI